MSYQRIRQLKAPEASEAQYDASHRMLSTHLRHVRGTNVEDPGKLFDQMHSPPNKIANRIDLDWYRQWYPNRTY